MCFSKLRVSQAAAAAKSGKAEGALRDITGHSLHCLEVAIVTPTSYATSYKGHVAVASVEHLESGISVGIQKRVLSAGEAKGKGKGGRGFARLAFLHMGDTTLR